MARSFPGPRTGLPSISMRPDVGLMRPSTILMKVVLPHPLGPTSATNVLSSTLTLTSARATKRLPSRWRMYCIPSPMVSSLTVIPVDPCRGLYAAARMRPPLVEAPLDLRQELERDHADDGKDHDAHQHDIRVEGGAGLRDHLADAGLRDVELGDEHSDQGASRAQAKPREDERHRRRQHDGLEDLVLRRLKAAGGFDQRARRRLDRVARVHDDRKNGRHEDQR